MYAHTVRNTLAGSGRRHVEGVTLKPWRDDGSEAWAEMWERVKEKPVREMYTPPTPRL